MVRVIAKYFLNRDTSPVARLFTYIFNKIILAAIASLIAGILVATPGTNTYLTSLLDAIYDLDYETTGIVFVFLALCDTLLSVSSGVVRERDLAKAATFDAVRNLEDQKQEEAHAHTVEMKKLRDDGARSISSAQESHEAQVKALETDHNTKIQKLIYAHETEIDIINKQYQQKIEKQNKIILIKDKIIHDQEQERRVDQITQIPNEIAFIKDIEKVCIPGNVLIMIDLVDFGRFNTKETHKIGDEILYEIAQFIFLKSRRLEKVYRLDRREIGDPESIVSIEHQSIGSAYRLHRAGDEFIVGLQGGEVEALGFLKRLRREITRTDSPVFQLAGENVEFYAGVFEIRGGVEPNECVLFVDKCLSEARRGTFGRRVVWHSATTYKQLEQLENENSRYFDWRRDLFESFEEDIEWSSSTVL